MAAKIFNSVLDKVLKAFAGMSALLLLFIWALVFTSILGRAFRFPAPQWEFQFTELSLFGITLLSMAWVLRRGRHVVIDVLVAQLRPKRRITLNLVHNILGTIACLIVTFFSAGVTWSLYKTGVIEENVVDLPKWMVVSIIPLGFFLFSAEFFWQLIDSVKKLKNFDKANQDEMISKL